MPLNEADCPNGIDPSIWAEHVATRAARDAASLRDVNARAAQAQADQDAPPSAADMLLMRARTERINRNSYGLTATGSSGIRPTAAGLTRGKGA